MSTDQIALPGPVYCMRKYHCPSFLDRKTRRNRKSRERIGICPQLLLSGGGGSTKSGIANYLVVLLKCVDTQTIGGIKRSADGYIHFKPLIMEDLGEELVHDVVSASNVGKRILWI